MKLSKKQELLALGSALYLLGLEVEAGRAKLEEYIDQASAAGKNIPITQEFLDDFDAFDRANEEFTRLEKRYLQLKQEL